MSDMQGMHPEIDVPSGPAYDDAALEGLVRVNQLLMKRTKVPLLYRSGVRYKIESGPQRWRHALEIIREGKLADCKNLAAWRTAELRHTGTDPAAKVHCYRTGPGLLHAVVARGDGSLEDPSRRLGMGGGDQMQGLKVGGNRDAIMGVPNALAPLLKSADEQIGAEYIGAAAEYIGADPVSHGDITFSWERSGAGWTGTVRVPLDMGRALFVRRGHADKDKAMKSAMSVASKVLDSPAAQALIPPQAKFALNIIRSAKARSIAKKLLSLF